MVLIKLYGFTMTKAVLRIYALLLAVNCSFCYNIPGVDFAVYPKGFSVSIPDEKGIEMVFFYGSVNKVACSYQPDSILLSACKCNGEKWVLESDTTVKIGDVVYYWLYVKKDGVGYAQRANFYNITEILSLDPSDSILDEPDTIDLQAGKNVATNPRLNLDPYYYHINTPSVLAQTGTINPPSNLRPPAPNIKPPTKTAPLHLDPFKLPLRTSTPLSLDPVKLTLSTKRPFSLHSSYVTKMPLKTNRPILDGITPMLYYINANGVGTSRVTGINNCTQLPEGESYKNPKRTECKLSEVDPHYHYGVNRYDIYNQEWNGYKPSQDRRNQPPRNKYSGEFWYWNRK